MPPAPVRTGPDIAVSPIAWKTVDGIKAGDRPLLLWIAETTLDAAVEHRAFDDSDVRLAAGAFRLARISPSDARLDPILSAYAGSAPALLVFAPDLSRATITYGATITPRAVLAATRGFAATYLRLDLDASIARARVLVAEQHALDGERTSISTTSAEPEATRRRARIAVIDTRLSAIHTELAALFRSRAS